MFDFEPAAQTMTRLVHGVRDEQLAAPTPCEATSLADLLDHVNGLTLAFTAAAAKEPLPGGPQAPSADGSRLGPHWRAEIAGRLERLVSAWRDPAAWEGTAMAGPVQMPAPVTASVALDELVVHAWDVAVSTGQPFEVDPASLEVCMGFLTTMSSPERAAMRAGIFGPVVEVTEDADEVDRMAALAGRNPSWGGR